MSGDGHGPGRRPVGALDRLTGQMSTVNCPVKLPGMLAWHTGTQALEDLDSTKTRQLSATTRQLSAIAADENLRETNLTEPKSQQLQKEARHNRKRRRGSFSRRPGGTVVVVKLVCQTCLRSLDPGVSPPENR